MNWTDKIDQRQSALLLTFYMLISMVLTIIRAGLDNRVGSVRFAPEHGNTQGATPFLDDASLKDALATYIQSTTPPPPEFYEAALTLLYAAEVVARMLGATVSEIYELMKQAFALAHSLQDQDLPDRAPPLARQYGQAGAPFDTS